MNLKNDATLILKFLNKTLLAMFYKNESISLYLIKHTKDEKELKKFLSEVSTLQKKES